MCEVCTHSVSVGWSTWLGREGHLGTGDVLTNTHTQTHSYVIAIQFYHSISKQLQFCRKYGRNIYGRCRLWFWRRRQCRRPVCRKCRHRRSQGEHWVHVHPPPGRRKIFWAKFTGKNNCTPTQRMHDPRQSKSPIFEKIGRDLGGGRGYLGSVSVCFESDD